MGVTLYLRRERTTAATRTTSAIIAMPTIMMIKPTLSSPVGEMTPDASLAKAGVTAANVIRANAIIPVNIRLILCFHDLRGFMIRLLLPRVFSAFALELAEAKLALTPQLTSWYAL